MNRQPSAAIRCCRRPKQGAACSGLTLAEWPMAEKDVYARIYEAFNARVNEASAR